LNTTLTPHSIIHGDACFAYFNKIRGIPAFTGASLIVAECRPDTISIAQGAELLVRPALAHKLPPKR
jgi:hypothetical protein